jgi:N-acetylglucosaminyl-diphospho-decaprenol L-rhamnosyltransferase
MHLTILIVSWNVRDLLRQCLVSLGQFPATQADQTIIVVDNASSDGTIEMLRRDFPHVHVIANTVNRGFTGGNNDGLKQLLDHNPQPTFVLLLNPDTEITSGALDVLLDYAQGQPQVGLIGPQLRYPDGRVQSSRRRFPNLLTGLFESTWLQDWAPKHVLEQFYMRDMPDTQTVDADWVVGAAMLVRAELIAQVGLLDEEHFFMYSEETDWCRRIKNAGWRVVYHPASVIIHHEGQSSKQVSARRMLLFNTSKVRYFAKHHGAVIAMIVRVGLLAQFTWQLTLEAAKWLLGSQRPLRCERTKAYYAVIRSKLI